MAKASIKYVNDNEYYTPKEFVDIFGKFDYDPATVKEKADEFGITNFDTIETDWLNKDWTQYKRIWINPPFTRKQEFINKAWETYKIAKNDIYILFPIEFLTTAKFHISTGWWKIFIPNWRVNFQSWLGKKRQSPPFWSIVMKVQDIWEIEPLIIK